MSDDDDESYTRMQGEGEGVAFLVFSLSRVKGLCVWRREEHAFCFFPFNNTIFFNLNFGVLCFSIYIQETLSSQKYMEWI